MKFLLMSLSGVVIVIALWFNKVPAQVVYKECEKHDGVKVVIAFSDYEKIYCNDNSSYLKTFQSRHINENYMRFLK